MSLFFYFFESQVNFVTELLCETLCNSVIDELEYRFMDCTIILFQTVGYVTPTELKSKLGWQEERIQRALVRVITLERI